MNKLEKNCVCVASIIEGFMMVVKENGSVSAAKLAGNVLSRSNAVILLHDRPPTTKHVKSMERRIKRFERDVLQEKPHTAISLTSALLAMVEDVVQHVDSSRADVWLKMEKSLFALHKYYDRNLNNNLEYACGAEMAYKWVNYV